MKKGQVTVFVILSLIVITLLILGYYYKDQILTSINKKAITEEIILPEEITNVEEYVGNCLSISGEEAINLIGQRGGYIKLPEEEFPSAVNPFGNSLNYGGETAYWYYKSSNGLDKFQKPSLDEMEESLGNYISNEIENCLDLKDFDFPIIKGSKDVDVEIKDKEVDITLIMPIIVYLNDKAYNIDSFNVVVKEPLGRLYDEASKIFELENNNLFLEENTLDIMAMYEEIPYSGVDFNCEPKFWNKQEVINNLKRILELNIPEYNSNDKMLRVDKLSSDVSTDFIFNDGWPFVLSTVPDEEILRGESYNEGILGRVLTTFFCLNQYHFVYSIKYPVLVSLSKDDYVFNFADLVVIENNQGRKNKFLDEKSIVEDKICSNKQGNIRVYSNVRNADVSLKCSRVVCSLGSTKEHNDGIYYEGETIPCVNGEIIVERSDYTQGKVTVGLDEDSILVLLKSINELGLEIKIGRALTSEENAIVSFESDEYSTVVYYPSQETINLAEGTHDVKAYVIKEGDGFKIKGKIIENCVEVPREGILGYVGFNEKKCTNIKIDDMEAKQFIIGGGEFSVYISDEDLKKNKLILDLVSTGTPKDIDEFANMYNKVRGLEGDVQFE